MLNKKEEEDDVELIILKTNKVSKPTNIVSLSSSIEKKQDDTKKKRKREGKQESDDDNLLSKTASFSTKNKKNNNDVFDSSLDRYEEKTTSKSDGRKVLEAQWNDAFYYEPYPGELTINKSIPFHDEAIIVLADEIQALKGFGSTWNSIPTDSQNYKLRYFEDLSKGMRKSAENILANSKTTLMYGFLLDKSKYVPISKGVEQTKRNLKIAKGGDIKEYQEKGKYLHPEDGISFKDRRPYIYPQQPIPTDWNLAKHDRKDTLQDIIKQLCKSFCVLSENDLEIDLTYAFNIPFGKRVFVDGHNLGLADVIQMACIYPSRTHALTTKRMTSDFLTQQAFWNQLGFQTDEDVYQTPICFENTIDAQGNSYYAIYFLPKLKNQVGEADFTLFTLYKLGCKMLLEEDPTLSYYPFLPVDFISIDTDIIYLALLYIDKIRKIYKETIPQIWVRYWPQLSWVFCRENPDPTVCKWAHINRLYEWIEIKAKFPPGLNHPQSSIDETDDIIEKVTKKKRKDTKGEEEKKQQQQDDDDDDKKKKKKVAKKPPKKMIMPNNESLLKKYSHEFKIFIINRSWSVIITLFIGGGDYTCGYQRITHEKLFIALKTNAKYIGELVGWESSEKLGFMKGHYVVSGQAYSRLIKCAYILSRPNLVMMDPANITWEQIYESTNHLSPDYRAPTIYQMKNRFSHLSHYVALLSQLGESYVHECRPFEAFAFERLHQEKEWASENILRVTNGIIHE